MLRQPAHHRRDFAWVAAALACSVAAWAMGAAPARADVVGVTGKPPTIDVQITAFHDGQLEYRISSGREASNPIEDIDYLQITGWPLFNLAEKQQRDGHVRLASSNYERLLKQLAEPKAGEVDRRQLLRCRLMRAMDLQGRFDQAVEVYLDIIEQDPSLAERVRPTRYPAPGSTFLQSAVKSVNAAIKRHGQDEIARSLIRWRDSWPSTESRPVSASGPAASQPAGTTGADNARRLGEIQQLIDKGRFDAALKGIETILKGAPDAAGADIFFWQGRALSGRAGNARTEEAVRDRKRAGLAFMRVVIHFPGHALAPQSLYEAGEICRLSGQKSAAAGLWSELIRSYPAAAEWVQRAKKSMETLKE